MKNHALIIFFGAVFLIFFGSYLVMSASSTISKFNYSDQFHLFNSHIMKAMFGIFIMVIVATVPYKWYREYSKMGIIVIVVMLLMTLFLSPKINGAHRWLSLGFIRFQPSDLARLILLVHLAAMIESKGELLKDFHGGLKFALIWIFAIAGLVFMQPNVSNGTMIVMIGLTMLFIAGARLKHLASTVGASIVGASLIAVMFSHSRERIIDFVNSFSNGGSINMQINQALLSLGSGGVLGVGFGHSNQRNLFLPEAYGDMIFAILGEETGFIGTFIILGMYMALFFVGMKIAKRTPDVFGQMLAIGISLSFVLYAFVNAGVASGILPTTGLPLPLISHGGTSILVLCISLGMLINIGFSNSKVVKQLEEDPA